MQFELWNDVAPKHVESFLSLTKQGFFDGGAFHRIIPGFVIQGGDPNAKIGYGPDGLLSSGDKRAQAKWGTGGPGYNVKAEFNPRKHEFGVLSMARANDPDSAGSQFFVCLGSLPSVSAPKSCDCRAHASPQAHSTPCSPQCLTPNRMQLDNKYTTFGKLIKGEDVLKRIASAKTAAGDRPERRQGIERMDAI